MTGGDEKMTEDFGTRSKVAVEGGERPIKFGFPKTDAIRQAISFASFAKQKMVKLFEFRMDVLANRRRLYCNPVWMRTDAGRRSYQERA